MVRNLVEHPITLDECVAAVERASLEADEIATEKKLIGDMHALTLRRAAYMLSRVKSQEVALNEAHDLITRQLEYIQYLEKQCQRASDEPG